MSPSQPSGGSLIADVLHRRGVQFLFTLCGGHIAPILVSAKAKGLRVVDMRDEAHAVFAADAVARMTGIAGVAAVTAGPGVTNTVTAVKNAQMAQSPVIVLGGATATVLTGRGSLQDIPQLPLMREVTKWSTSVANLADLAPTLEHAFDVATAGVPGPVFIEVPVDLLYPEEIVRSWYMKESGVERADTLGAKALRLYLQGHLYRQFHGPRSPASLARQTMSTLSTTSVRGLADQVTRPASAAAQIRDVAARLAQAKRPVLVIGSQAVSGAAVAEPLAAAVRRLGIPTFLGGMSRGLLGSRDDLQFRHHRAKALRAADLVIVAGFPFDFRLGYGRSIGKNATLVAANLSARELRTNRRPQVAVEMHPGEFLIELSQYTEPPSVMTEAWHATLRTREAQRDAEIAAPAAEPSVLVNPLAFFGRLEAHLSDDAVLVVDGGDFAATAAYVLRPRAPLRWLDPGVFGTLGVGGGFAAGAALVHPGTEIWLIYGDGSSAYSLAEFDTFARHGLAPIAVIGNDGSWAQIAREQIEVLGDAVGTELERRAYHQVAEGYGGVGLLLDDPRRIDEMIRQAKALARAGKPVCLNVHLDRSLFRKGSISL